MANKQDQANWFRVVAALLAFAGSLFAVSCIGVAAGAAVGFGSAAALCFAWAALLIGVARRSERNG